MVKSIPDQLLMFGPEISPVLDSVTGSLGSADGVLRSGSPAGLTIDPSGRDRVPVNPSRRPAVVMGAPIRATFGRRGFGSSASADLSRSLANKLRARFDTDGSILFSMTWKEKATPQGRSVCLLRAWARRTAGRACGSWPTPVANDDNKTPAAHLAMKRRMGERDGTGANRTTITSLAVMAKTTAAGATMAGWPTPKAHDADGGASQPDGKRGASLLTMAGWATPCGSDTKGAPAKPYNERGGGRKGQRLDSQVVHLGPILSGSPALMASSGQLNPVFCRWLMGYPAAWDVCADTATRSSRKSRPK
jgi:hypothetical protein